MMGVEFWNIKEKGQVGIDYNRNGVSIIVMKSNEDGNKYLKIELSKEQTLKLEEDLTQWRYEQEKSEFH